MMKFLQEFWRFLTEPEKSSSPEQKKDSSQQSITESDEDKRETSSGKTSKQKNVIKRIRKKNNRVSIQVGLDFGTSSTKVVYSQRGNRYFKTLSFDHDLPGYPPYCVPSLVAIDNDQNFKFGAAAAKTLADEPWDSGLRRFKILVAGEIDTDFEDPVTRKNFDKYCCKKGYSQLSPARVTAIYLAWIMTVIKNKISSRPEFENSEVSMSFNVGIPIEQIEEDPVHEEYERILTWAELIHREWNVKGSDFSFLAATYEFEEEIDKFPDEKRRVFTIPESVAQVASYTDSLEKREGLHSVIDLGAGTTDLSIFMLARDLGHMNSKWFAARNIPTGCDQIIRKIVENNTNEQMGSSEKYNFEQVDKKVKYLAENPRKAGVVKKEFKKLWASQDYKRTWGSAYGKLKSQKKWEDVEIFLCGGGAEFYKIAKQFFSLPWWQNLSTKYKVRKLPEPDDFLIEEEQVPFTRMAVAYGLAIPRPALDKFHLPNSTPDQTPPRMPKLNKNRDDYYPKD